MQHRYSMRLIAYMLLFNHSLMSCYNPSLGQKNQRVPMHPEDVIINEPIEYTSTAFMTLEPVHKPTDLGTNEVFLLELFIGSKLTASGNIESEAKTIEEPISFQHVASEIRAEKAIKEKNPFRRVSCESRAEAALKIEKKCIESEEENENVYVSKGNALSSLGRYEAAISCYDKAISVHPTYAQAYHNKGVALYELGRYEAAISCYNKAISVNPNNPQAYDNKGNALSSLGRYEVAIACYDQVLELNPNNPQAYNNKGVALYELGRYEAAISCYNKAISVNPNNPQAYNNKGLALYLLGKKEESIACFDKALALNPNDAQAYRQRERTREAEASRQSASSSPKKGFFSKLWGAVCNVGRSIGHGCKKAFTYANKLVSKVYQAAKRGIFSVVSRIIHGCKKAFTYANPLVTKVYQTAKKVILSTINGFKKAVIYAKKNLWPKVCKVAKFIYNRIVKPVSKFIWKHKKPILIGIGIFILVGIVVCYPYVGTPTILGILSKILFGKNITTSDKTSSQNNQDNINLFQFIVEYFLHRKQENKPNLNGAVERTSATGRRAPPKAVASQAPVAPSDHPSWQNTYTKLTDFAGSIKERMSEFSRNLVDKVSKVGSWFKGKSSPKTTTSPLPTPTFVNPNVRPPMPTPAREASEAIIASHEPQVGQRLEEEKVEEDFQAELAMQELEDAKDEAVTIEEISFDNLEEAKLAAEAYLESFQQATPSQQAALRQKGMALVGSIESLKKITKDQYRTTGRSFVFTDMDAHSFPLFVAQRKDLHAQYVGFKSLRDQLQVSMSLSKAEARACGVRVRHNPATDLEEYYSSSEERDWSDQATQIK